MKTALIVFFVLLFSITVYSASADEPDRPTNLVADDVSPTKIELSWETPDDDGGKDITGYKIEAKSPPGSYYVLIYNTGSNSTTFTHSNLATDKTYIYRVFAINSDGESEASPEASATPTESSEPPEQIVPNSPTQLTAQDISPTEIELEWTKPTDNNSPSVVGYKIEHKVNAGTYTILVNNTANTSTTYTVTELTTNLDYVFRVSALNSIGFSSPSNEAAATPTATSAPEEDLIVPNSPTGVTAIALSPTEIQVSWNTPTPNNSPAITSYQIEVKVDDGAFEILVEDNGIQTSFNHENLDAENVYTYRISARNAIGLSISSGTSFAQPAHTLVPTQFTATEISPTQIKLEWNPPSQTYGQAIQGYEIQEKIALGTYETVASTGGTTTAYMLSGLSTNESYTYVVFAKFPLGSTDISEEVTITLTEESGKIQGKVPSKPINLQAVATSPIQIDLTWDAPANDGGSPITGYRIDVKVNVGEYITVVENTGSTGRTYTHTDRVPDTDYSYRIYAINEVGTSPASNTVSETPTASSAPPSSGTISSPPQNLEAKMISLNQINLSWDAPTLDGGSTISGYKIEVKKDSDAFVVLSPNTGKSTSYSHTGLELDATYTYRIYAINAIGDSNPSNLGTVTVMIEEEEPVDPKLRVPGFPDPTVDPQYYIDRYNTEPKYKEWFDGIFPEYTIYDIVGIPEPVKEPPTEKEIRLEYYLDRYNSEPAYKQWFDSYFNGKTLAEVIPEKSSFGICGEGTELKDGICQIIIE